MLQLQEVAATKLYYDRLASKHSNMFPYTATILWMAAILHLIAKVEHYPTMMFT